MRDPDPDTYDLDDPPAPAVRPILSAYSEPAAVPFGTDRSLPVPVADVALPAEVAANLIDFDYDPDCGCTPPCGHGTYRAAPGEPVLVSEP